LPREVVQRLELVWCSCETYWPYYSFNLHYRPARSARPARHSVRMDRFHLTEPDTPPDIRSSPTQLPPSWPPSTTPASQPMRSRTPSPATETKRSLSPAAAEPRH